MPRRDVVWIDVLPTPKGLARGVNKQLDGVGRRAGKQFGDEFEQGASDGADRAARQVEQRMARAQQSVDKAARAIEAARNREADAAGRVRVAESQLAQAKTAQSARTAQVSAAESALAAARSRAGATAQQTAAAETRLASARTRAAAASTAVVQGEERVASSTRQAQATQSAAAAASDRLASAQQRLARASQDVDSSGRRASGAFAGFSRYAGSLNAFNSAMSRTTRSMVLAVGGATAFGGALIGVSAAVPAVAALGAEVASLAGGLLLLPGAAAAAAGAMGTLAVGGLGVSDAFKAVFDDSIASGGAAQDAAGAHQQAAEQIRTARLAVRDAVEGVAQAEQQANRDAITSARAVASAQRGLRDARVSAAEAIRSAARSTADAERGLASAQREARAVQTGLTAAREEARRSLQDMNFDVRAAAIEQRRASMEFTDAREALAAAKTPTLAAPTVAPMSGAERGLGLESFTAPTAAPAVDTRAVQEAQLAFDTARLAYDQVNVRVRRLATDSAAANRAGVAGSQQVASAQDAIRSALQRVSDARRGVVDANRQQVQAQISGARQVVDAQQGVREAVEAQRWQQVDSARAIMLANRQVAEAQRGVAQAATQSAGTGSAALDKVNQAMGRLSPNARATVLAVKGVANQYKGLQQAVQNRLFAGLAGDVQRLGTAYLPTMRRGMLGVAGGINFAARDMAGFLAQSSTVSDVNQMFGNTSKTTMILGRSLRPVTAGLFDIGTVGSNYLPMLARSVERVAIRFRDWAEGARQSGELDRRIRSAIQTVKDMWATARNLGVVLREVFGASRRDQDRFFASTRQNTAELRKFVQSAEGQDKIRQFFTNLHKSADALKPGFRDLGKALFGGLGGGDTQLPDLAAGFSDVLSAVAKLIQPVRDFLIPLTAGKLAGFVVALEAVATVLNLIMPAIEPLAPVLGFALGAMGTFAIATKAVLGPLGLMQKSFMAVTTEAARARWGTAIGGAVNTMTAPLQRGLRNVRLFASTVAGSMRNAAVSAARSAASTGAGWVRSGAQAVAGAAKHAAAAARVRAQNFGRFLATLGGASRAWLRSGVQATLSATRQAVAAGRVRAQSFAGFIAQHARNAAGWVRSGVQATLSATRQAAAAARTRVLNFVGLIASNTRNAARWVRSGVVAGVSATRQVVASARVRALNFAGLIASNVRLAATWVRTGLAALLSGARQRTAAIRMGIARTATVLLTGAQRILNLVMRANPIALIITALATVATGLVAAYKKSKTFRNIVDKIGEVANWVWKNVFQPFFGFLGDVWSWTLQPIIDAVKWVVKKGGEFFKWVGSLFGAKDGAVVESNVTRKAAGGEVRPMAAGGVLGMAGGGGLTPMAPKAQTVAPNTWRVIGDRLRGREFYIPDDGSARSLGILTEAAKAFGMELAPLARGAVLALAAGGTARRKKTPTAAAARPATASTAPGAAAAGAATGLAGATGTLTAAQSALTLANNAATAAMTRFATAGLVPAAARINTVAVPALQRMQQQAGVTTTRAVRTLTQSTVPLRQNMNLTATNVRGTWQRNTTNVTTSVTRQRGQMRGLQTGLGHTRQAMNTTATTTRNTWQRNTNAVNTSVSAQRRAFGRVQTGMANTRQAMTQTASWAQRQFNRMYTATAGPARATIRGPFNKGIIAAWNKLNKEFAFKKKVAAVPIGFASGGQVPGIGNRDSVPSMLTPREVVWDKPAIRNAGGPAAVDALRMGFRTGRYSRLDNPAAGNVSARDRQRAMRTVPLDDLPVGLAYGGVAPHVAAAGNLVTRKFGGMPGGIGGVGARANASDHPIGLALDFMTMSNRALGDRVAGFLMGNAARLRLKYLIWKQMFNDGGGWSRMEDRGSITANHFDHVHASFLRAGEMGRAFAGGGMALFDPATVVRNAFKGVGKQIKAVQGRYPGNRSAEQFTGVASEASKRVQKQAVKKLNDLVFAGPGAGAGVQRWAPVVLQALRIMGQPASLLQTVLRRMNQESGGDAGIVNGWDSNAARGTPSAGLMQVIGPTYQAHKHPRFDAGPYKHGTSINPLSNILASMRYALSEYGSLPAAYNKAGGYDDGGWLQPGFTPVFNGTRKPEAVFTAQQLTNLTRGGDGADLEGVEISGRLELGDDGFARLVDGRIEKANEKAGARGRRGSR